MQFLLKMSWSSLTMACHVLGSARLQADNAKHRLVHNDRNTGIYYT